MKGARQWLGLVLLILVGAGIAGYKLLASSGKSGGSAAPAVTVTGYIGGEKVGFIQDPEVVRILHDRYGLTVNAVKAGSIEMVRGSTAGQDFLWPSSQLALDLYHQTHGGSARSGIIFDSPIVLYAWAPVADALQRAGIVKRQGGVYYVDNFPHLTRLILQGKPWSSIGLSSLYGPVTVFTTDPSKSNSGFMFTGLLADTLNHGRVVDGATLPGVLPQVKQFYDQLGYLESSSADLFDQFLKTGIGAKPMIAGYENQLVEYTIQNPSYRSLIQKSIRIMYPRPTVWSEHTFIALTPAGGKLLTALNDPDIQRLAWERHGFRTGSIGAQNNVAALKVSGVPGTITAIIPMPRFKVMDRILTTLSTG